MKVAELARELAEEVGESFAKKETNESFNRWVVRAVKEIYSQEAWPFSHTTESLSLVDGTAAYDLDVETVEPRLVTLSGVRDPLTLLDSVDRLLKDRADLTQESQPRVAYLNGRSSTSGGFRYSLGFWPVPDSSYTATVYGVGRTEDDFGDTPDDDEIPLPENFLPAVRERVLYRYRTRPEDVSLRREHKEEWERKLLSLRGRFAHMSGIYNRHRYTDLPREPGFGEYVDAESIV